MRFVVIVREGLNERVFGVYRSFKRAEGDARCWGGVVVPLEPRDAPTPWQAALLREG